MTNLQTPSSNDRSLSVVKKIHCLPDSDDLHEVIEEAMSYYRGMRLGNMVDEDGLVCVEVTIYDSTPEVIHGQDRQWWPRPSGWRTLERLELGELFVLDALEDPRWGTHQIHASSFHTVHAPSCGYVREDWEYGLIDWIVDISDTPLTAGLDYDCFALNEQ